MSKKQGKNLMTRTIPIVLILKIVNNKLFCGSGSITYIENGNWYLFSSWHSSLLCTSIRELVDNFNEPTNRML